MYDPSQLIEVLFQIERSVKCVEANDRPHTKEHVVNRVYVFVLKIGRYPKSYTYRHRKFTSNKTKDVLNVHFTKKHHDIRLV